MKGFFTYFKYEFLSSVKPLGFTYGMGIFALLLLRVVDISFSRKWVLYEVIFLADGVIEILLTTLMIGSFAAFGILLIVRAFQTFWVEIFGDRGYLSLTLPISLDAILLSKIVVLTLWVMFGLYFVGLMNHFDTLLVRLSYINKAEAWIMFINSLSNVVFYITLILFITALLNALKVRTFVLFKGFGIALIIHLVWIPLNFSLVLSVPSFFYMSSLGIDKICLSILFYFLARYLITYKLELE